MWRITKRRRDVFCKDADNDTEMKSSSIGIIGVVAAFIVVSYAVRMNQDFFIGMMGDHTMGKIVYVCITVLATVVAPISSIPLMAAAVGLWGFFAGAVLSILGWFIGSSIAFELSRAFGQKFVLRFLNAHSQDTLQHMVTQDYTMMSLILLRMSVPVDVLSYALGLFSEVGRKKYYIATALGIIPFGFVLAFFGTIEYRFQIAILVVVGIVIWYRWRTRKASL